MLLFGIHLSKRSYWKKVLALRTLLKKYLALSFLYFFLLTTQPVMHRNIHHEYMQTYTNILVVK